MRRETRRGVTAENGLRLCDDVDGRPTSDRVAAATGQTIWIASAKRNGLSSWDTLVENTRPRTTSNGKLINLCNLESLITFRSHLDQLGLISC